MSDLERAQEWLGCVEDDGDCATHEPCAWPCRSQAVESLAALLALVDREARADELERAASEYPAHVRSEDEFWSYNTTSDAVEEIGVEYLTNRAEDVRRG